MAHMIKRQLHIFISFSATVFFSYNTTLIDSSCNSLTFFGRRGIYDTRIYYRSTLRYVFCLGLQVVQKSEQNSKMFDDLHNAMSFSDSFWCFYECMLQYVGQVKEKVHFWKAVSYIHNCALHCFMQCSTLIACIVAKCF